MADTLDEESKTFPLGDASQLDFYKIKCLEVKKNDIVLLKERPCKIVEILTAACGKHGSTKKYLVGIDIFTNNKYQEILSSVAQVNVPNILEKEYQLLDVSDDGFASLLDEDTNMTREDLKLPKGDIGKQIKEKLKNDETVKAIVFKCMGEEQIVSYKLENN